MASRKTWVWVLVGVFGVGLLGLIGLAGAGVYLVTRHVSTQKSTGPDALRAFDAVKASFPNQSPIYELDNDERPTVTRPLKDLPTSSTKPEHLWVLAWDPDEERLIKISLPFWLLQMRKSKMTIDAGDRPFELDRLDLDGEELERIGPALVFDFREPDGTRVLLWTQ